MKFDRRFYKNISFWVYLILAVFAASSLGIKVFSIAWWGWLILSIIFTLALLRTLIKKPGKSNISKNISKK
ncbi:hypothetical protein [Furfurilactobacillus curtus]|uniref:Uncharacterized protein n=1 Tax=Furfurilactobacillus curtus TaxID=1746200 RepID=A0ABQ5JP41_9LACO